MNSDAGQSTPAARMFDAARFTAAIAKLGHGDMIGIRYVAHGEDWAELAFDHAPQLVACATSNILASGPIITAVDMATSLAVWVKQDRFRAHATLDLRVDYLRAAAPGRTVFARGECYRLARRIAFVRGQAHNGDAADPIAHVAGTFMFTGR